MATLDKLPICPRILFELATNLVDQVVYLHGVERDFIRSYADKGSWSKYLVV